VDADQLAELNRRAYGRSADDTAAVEARLELERLAAARAEAARPAEPPVLPPWPADRPRPRTLAVLLVGAMAAAALATVIVVTPPLSREIFDRPAAGRDLTAPEEVVAYGARPSTIRWLGDLDGISAWGYLNVSGSVCAAIVAPSGTSGSCTSPERFDADGVDLYFRFDPQDPRFLNLTWGPRAGASIVYVPGLPLTAG
jgi:hypothetical protein